MPLTPFHLGPGFVVGMIFKKWINIPTILLASVIVDVRAIYLALIIGDWSNLHGFFHTFVGATILGLLIIALVWFLRKYLSKISKFFKIEQDYSLKSIVIGSFVGVWLHIILDSYMHMDISPLLPFFEGNPFYGGMFAGFELLWICLFGFVVGGLLYIYNIYKK